MILWVKRDGKVQKIFQEYNPEFFAVPKCNIGCDFKRLKHILDSHPNVKQVRICDKYVKLEDHEKSKIYGVTVSKPSKLKTTIQEIDKLGLLAQHGFLWELQ